MVYDKIISILSKQLDLDELEINEDCSLEEDLGMGELDRMEILLDIEDEFDINIPEEDSDEFVTIGDIVNYVEDNT